VIIEFIADIIKSPLRAIKSYIQNRTNKNNPPPRGWIVFLYRRTIQKGRIVIQFSKNNDKKQKTH